jgi:hypothetical protein
VREYFTARYGEAPDLEDFLAEIVDCGFVQSIGGRAVSGRAADAGATGTRSGLTLLAGLPAARVAWLLSRPMRALYLIIWLTVPLLFAVRRDLTPAPTDAAIAHWATLNVLILATLGWALISLHEVAHLVIARARGCAGSLTLSHRLYFLVAQSDLTSVRALPPNLRYAPYLAGMTADMAVLLACSLLRMAGVRSPLAAAVGGLALGSVVFQCLFFMRTDVYYIVTTRLQLGNLLQDAQHWLANLACRIAGRPEPHDLSGIPNREMALIRWYAAFHAAGVITALAGLALLGWRLVTDVPGEAAARTRLGPAHPAFWDGIGVAVLATANMGLLAVVWWKGYRRRVPATRGATAGGHKTEPCS